MMRRQLSHFLTPVLIFLLGAPSALEALCLSFQQMPPRSHFPMEPNEPIRYYIDSWPAEARQCIKEGVTSASPTRQFHEASLGPKI